MMIELKNLFSFYLLTCMVVNTINERT